MAPAQRRQLGPESLLQHIARGLGGQHAAERRAIEAVGGGEGGARRIQQRAALLDVIGDVVEIGARQHAFAPVAVEDDEVEILEPQLEQLAHGKGDQRQLVDRRAVLLFRRAQNGEMDQIDGGIGFQQRAPGALAGMGLAGDQQHLQPVAHAIDQSDGRVVGEAQLLGPRLDGEFEDVLAAMVDVEIEGHVLADGDLDRRQGLAVLHDVDAGERAGRCRAILDPELEGDGLVDDAEAGGGDHDQAPVGFVGQAAQQHMHRGVEAEGIEIAWACRGSARR